MSREWVEKSTILRVEVGSGVHGIAVNGTDDRDEMGVCLEPYRLMVGVSETFEEHIYRTATERTGDRNARSQPGDLDLVVYSLRKWVRLALRGNPNVTIPLFAPASAIVLMDARGQQLRELAPAFASRQGAGRFLGYLKGQKERLLGQRGQKDVNRRELVEKFGYDTKYAGHMLRLGYQGVEYMERGRYSLPMPEPQMSRVRAVRLGQVPLAEVLAETEELEEKLRMFRFTSPLPETPDVAKIEEWVNDVYFEHYKATFGHEKQLRLHRAFGGKATLEPVGG